MDPILELPISLPRGRRRGLLRAVHSQLRAAILDGRLQPGLRLPATRLLSSALGVSRNTAVACYELLLSEGYLVSRPGSGTYVANIRAQAAKPSACAEEGRADHCLSAFWRKLPAAPAAAPASSCRFDFRTGLPDKASFRFDIWRRLSARALRRLSKAPAAYAEPEGRPELREAIARHVSFARAVGCRADDVVITAGAQQAFDLLARILVTPGRTVVAVEEPCYPPLRDVFAAAGGIVSAIPVDGEGLMVHRLRPRTRVICVTPSHQFPLGVIMSPRRRAALLDFAHANDAIVIEDDYDGEFRFGGRPLDALQTLDRAGSVFYVGTFSKSLFPALRLGFVVAPPWARGALVRAKQLTDWHAAALAQDTLAAFIAEGHLARHVRKMRKVYGDRRSTLLNALERHCGHRLRPMAGDAGLHLAAQLLGSGGVGELVAKAADVGIGLQGWTRSVSGETEQHGLTLGYGMIGAGRIDDGIRRLGRLLNR